jgi:zinc protease
MRLPRLIPAFLALLLAACAAQPAQLASVPAAKPDWAFQQSDLPVDPGYRFGKLDNGLRYIVRKNGTPAGTAQVRMDIGAGSLDETDAERGYAHFVEHMAFNGSTRVPEGEMVKLLERDGLAFGADTNAQTGFEQTLYILSLPKADPKLLDTALMLFRETASELTFAPEAVDRERGVVMSELREQLGYQRRNLEDQLAFFYPDAHYPARLPIGVPETLEAANAETLKAFWRREYVPANTTVIVIGDFDPDLAEQAIRDHFASWAPAPVSARPPEGKVDPKQKRAADVFIDPALSERVTVSRHGAWLDEPDSVEVRRVNLLRQIGYGIINRRLQSRSRVVDPPFRAAGFGTAGVFEIGRTTNLIVDTTDGGWAAGLGAAADEYFRAMAFGFTDTEVAEQVANVRTGLENAAAASGTRSNTSLVGAALALVRDELVPTTPESGLARFNSQVGEITPAAVLAALKDEAVPLGDPLIRFQGRAKPSGGGAALFAAWDAAAARKPENRTQDAGGSFAYTDFGQAGAVLGDRIEPGLGIREVVFANGVRLNLKKTDLAKNQVLFRLSLDGGELIDTRDDPLATEMLEMFAAGGLGKHSQDELQTLLAGRSVGAGFAATGDVFTATATTTPRDLELQLQLLAAYLVDPGYRPEGEQLYRQNIANFFARYRATPNSALSNLLGGILSDNDPRFTLQKPDDYQALSFARLKSAIGDRLTRGAIEIGVVGDIDEDAVIAAVAKTFGALPPREPDFLPYPERRSRPFTARRGERIIRHTGDPSQAIVHYTWPTRDDSDAVESLELRLLEKVVEIELVETIREKLGKAYSPGAASSLSRVWPGYGTFGLAASVDVSDVAATRKALDQTIAALIAAPVDDDVLRRARAPMLEELDNALKSNARWLAIVDRAQSEPDQIERYLKAKERLSALTAANVQAMAARYLDPAKAVKTLVLPEEKRTP